MDTTNAPDTARNSSGTASGTTYALNGKIMLCTVLILFFAVFIVLGFHTYGRWFACRRRRHRHRHRHHSRVFHFLHHHHNPAATASRGAQGCAVPHGLDINILKTLPTFVYSDATCTSRDRECSVCLSEFGEGETGRVLPECNHGFHAECIDMWFYSHSNCPICRAPVRPGKPVDSGNKMVPMHGSGSDLLIQVVEPDPVSPSTLVAKTDDLVSILVEAPQRMEERHKGMDDMGPGHTGLNECNRVKYPGNRILSLKRIWSI